MGISAAPALLIGLGARIFLDIVTRSDEASFRDYILVGCWMGVAFWYASKKHDLTLPAAAGVAGKVCIEFMFMQDTLRAITTVICTAVGFVTIDVLSAALDAPASKSKKAAASNSQSKSRRHREGHTSSSSRRLSQPTVSDITSVDSNSELIGPRGTMSPLEREVAALRTRASLADSERRRFKEERKWAVSQGNLALASQLKWQVKRYSTLMKSFHRQADAKLVEASHSRTRLEPIAENQPQASRQPKHHPTISVDISPAQVKSGIRVNVR